MTKITHHKNGTFSISEMNHDTFDQLMHLIHMAADASEMMARNYTLSDAHEVRSYLHRRAGAEQTFDRSIIDAVNRKDSYTNQHTPFSGTSVKVPQFKIIP